MQNTSLEAYIQEQPRIQSQVEKVKDFFRKYPTMQFSDADLKQLFHWQPNVIESRRSQLVRDGYLIKSGFKINKATGHRVQAYKWRSKP